MEAQPGRAEFPPLATRGRYATNLPAPATPLIGRAPAVAAVAALLRPAGARLVTLTGPGGTGKTRLALQAAATLLDDFADGVYFVALAPVQHPALVIPAIAGTLGVPEVGYRPLFLCLQTYLASRQMLLVLDNFEQVLAAAGWVSRLLAAAPGLCVLVTSRERLQLPGEHEFPVPPLGLPDRGPLPPPEVLIEVAAIALFVERARAAQPGFVLTPENAPAVAAICARLDGLPLAIELAAARSPFFPPAALLARLDSRFTLLLGGGWGVPARQQTLRGAIDWSFDLLSPGEQILFRRLAVFAGGWTLEAAEAVCGGAGLEDDAVGDLLPQLVSKSLVVADAAPPYRLLEVIRQYAGEKLAAAGEVETLHRRHMAFYQALAVAAAPHLSGPQSGAWLDQLAADHANLRVALERAIAGGAAATAAQTAGALWRFWLVRGFWSEGRRWLAAALAAGTVPPAVRAQALYAQGRLAKYQEDFPEAVALLTASLDHWRALGDRHNSAAALYALGYAAQMQGDYPTANAHYVESLALEPHDSDRRAHVLISLGLVALAEGDLARAAVRLEESLARFQSLGDQRNSALALRGLGLVALKERHFARAIALHEAALAHFRDLGDAYGIAIAIASLGYAVGGQGDLVRATALHAEALERSRDLGDKRGIAEGLAGLATVAAAQGDLGRAARLWGAAEALTAATGLSRELADAPFTAQQLAAVRARLDAAAFA
ncbi:MAG TPA: tetratricopeptide repeat protein, partial [Chloroflexia bacterium]|nr:tetratricopeptide repeat protein [Chloroflexia bacterium]